MPVALGHLSLKRVFSIDLTTCHTATFTAVLNILVQDEDARVISRPYLATTSGTSAHLEITEDRFVVVQAPGGIDVTLEKISSGIILEILPVITKDGRISLDIEIDQSQFIPTLENVEQRRSRNSISTSTTVKEGSEKRQKAPTRFGEEP